MKNPLKFFADISKVQQQIGYNLRPDQLKDLRDNFPLEQDNPEYHNALTARMIVMSVE